MSRSPLLAHLQIIDSSVFQHAQKSEKTHSTPKSDLNINSHAYLAGIVYCGHCGSRLTPSTNGKYYIKKNGDKTITKRIRYTCYGKTRKRVECNGQTGYSSHILEREVDKAVRSVLATLKNSPCNGLIYPHQYHIHQENIGILGRLKHDC